MKDNTKSYLNAFSYTIILTGLYIAFHHLPLFTTTGAYDLYPDWYRKHMGEVSILSLGLRPAFAGFLALEIFSIIVPPLNHWRMQGAAGRAKLNFWAWWLSFVFCFINAVDTTYELKHLLNGHIEGHFFWFQVLTTLALMGGFAFCVILAQLITRYGVGNGFLIIYLFGNMPTFVQWSLNNFHHYQSTQPDGDQNFMVLAMFVGLCVFTIYLWKFICRLPRFPFHTATGKIAWFEVPPFPSSAKLQGFALVWIGSIGACLSIAHIPNSWMLEGWSHIGLELGAMALFGILFYHWFWSIDVFGTDVADLAFYLTKRQTFLDKHLKRSLAILLFGAALFWVPIGPRNFKSLFWIINFSTVLWFFGLFQDLWSQWRFWASHGRGVSILEMDNMVLVSYLKGFFKAEEIPCHLQCYHFRLLMFWFTPLYKVCLLVPEEYVEKAQKLLTQVSYKVI